jgi:hypothetical protein
MLSVAVNPFPNAHQFVTERPSVAQNHAQVTAATLLQPTPQIPSEKFPRRQNP